MVATIDKKKFYTFASLNNIVVKENCGYDIRYIVAVLNSKLMNWYYSMNFSNRSALTVNVSKTFLEKLPIKRATELQQKSLIDLTDEILSLNEELNRFGDSPSDKKYEIENKIEKISKQIDEAIYEIYNMTKDEKKAIEESLK